MPRIISPEEKISVIGDWLDGETREHIAVKHKIGNELNLLNQEINSSKGLLDSYRIKSDRYRRRFGKNGFWDK